VGKSMTLRLAVDQAAELEAVARADNVPVAEAVRQAIEAHIARSGSSNSSKSVALSRLPRSARRYITSDRHRRSTVCSR